MNKEIKRGYVKWEDLDGFHKEPLADHPELLASASPAEQLRAEEARRLNAAAEEAVDTADEAASENTNEVLADLKAAPEEVLTAAQLTDEEPVSAASEEPVSEGPVDEDHEAALRELREKTSS